MMLLTVVSSVILWKNKDAILETIQEATAQPDHGKETFIESQFGPSIALIGSAADECSSVEDLKVRLTNDSDLPLQVLYIACKGDGSGERKLVKRLDWQSLRTSTTGNYGSGKLGSNGKSIPICIYRRAGDWDYIDELVVYFELPELEESSSASDTL